MSVGHLARMIEEAGIATVIIASSVFEDRLKSMCIPRALFTTNIMGRPLGAPGDAAGQEMVLRKALRLLESAESNSTIDYF